MIAYIRGRRWRFRFARLDPTKSRGDCDPPNVPNKEIRVCSTLPLEEELEVTLHEFMHAMLWDLSEEMVEEASRDAARLLWRLGWRKA